MLSEDVPSERRAWRRHVARALLLLGALLIALRFTGAAPEKQHLSFVLSSEDSIRVRRVEVSWSQSDDDESLGGVALNFPDGAPSVVKHTINVPNGEYIFTIRLERADPSREAEVYSTVQVRRVTLEGGETKLFLKDSDR